MYKKYIKIEKITSPRYEYDELDIGTLFCAGMENELFLRTEDGALSLKDYNNQLFKSNCVVYPCEVTEIKRTDDFDTK